MDCSLKQEGIIVRYSIEAHPPKGWWVVHEVEMDQSLNVNNGDTSSVDETLPPVKQAGGFKLECFESGQPCWNT